jgi:CheY-like chemotaxis protein
VERAIDDDQIILLVNDNQATAGAMVRLFEQVGMPCEVRADANEAIDRAFGGDVAFVCTNLHVPGVSGREVLGLIRSHEQSRPPVCIPVVAIAAVGTAEDRARCLADGFIAYLAKPVRRDALEAAILHVAALRGALIRNRHTCNRDGIVARLLGSQGKPENAIEIFVGLSLLLESCGCDLIYRALLAVYRSTPDLGVTPVIQLGSIASGIGALELAELAGTFAESLKGRVESIERAAVLTRAELDRVVFTLRKEAIRPPPDF